MILNFLVKPYPHQMEVFELAKRVPSIALLWEMGTGKTGAIINIIRQKFLEKKRVRKTLILTPLVTVYNWRDEFSKFSKIEKKFIVLPEGTGAKRIKELSREILDHEGIANRGRIVILNWEAIRNEAIFDLLVEWGPEIIIGDELHKIKNHQSKIAKKAVKIADSVRHRKGFCYGLTGTPILNRAEDIFMQYRFLDGGKLFGGNFYTFRRIYFQDKNERWASKPGHFPNWEIRPEAYKELHNKINKIATRITKKECLKHLPPLIKERRYVELNKEQKRMYKEMKEEFITFVNNKSKSEAPAVVANLAITKALRLMQIVSGFAIDEQGEVHDIGKIPRVEAVKELLEEITPRHKVILWCSYKDNYKKLGKLCDKMGLEHVFLHGGITAKDKAQNIKRFQEDDKVRVIIANRGAGGIGVNLTAASYSIVFSRNFSLGEEKQSEARNHRGGSEVHQKITKIDLIAKGTIDELVLEALDNKQKVSDLIIDWSVSNDI